MRTIINSDGSASRLLETVEDHIAIEKERGASDTLQLRNFILETTDWDKDYIFHGWGAEKTMTIRDKDPNV
jgi:hypothetical protein